MPFSFKSFLLLLLSLGILACSEENQAQKNCSIQFNLNQTYQAYQSKGEPLAAIDFSKKLDPEWVKKDWAIFRDILEESNTSLYRYTSKNQMDSLFEATQCALTDSVFYLDFIRYFGKAFHTISCGHSHWSHNPAYLPFRNTSLHFFPLKIYALRDRYFVKQNGSYSTQIYPFDEILSINGRKPPELNAMLSSHMGKDGNSGLQGRTGIERYFQMAYSNFIANPDSFHLELKRDSSDSIYTLSVAALPKSEIDSLLSVRYTPEPKMGKPLVLTTDNNTQTATYTIKWFRNEYMTLHGQDFNTFTDSVFQEIENQNIQNLIIDLRGNVGGWTANGKHLFSYFIDKPMSYIKKVEFKKTDSLSYAPLILRENGISDTMQFKTVNGLKEWANYPSLTVIPAPKNRFGGKVYILTDDMSRSCSVIFSSMMRSHTDAEFIGEETGGAKCGQNAMLTTIQLPYTGIIIAFSTGQYTCNVSALNENDMRGIRPNHPVNLTLDNLKSGEDIAIKQAMNQIRKGNSSILE
jgi:hypothetical protein